MININIKDFINTTNRYKIASYILILIGISIRVYHYIVNRSFWLDEAMLSNNIINRNLLQLLEPLDNLQIAPIGFLLVQKISIMLFGVNEYSLRLLPLLSGIISLPLFYLLLKKIFDEKLSFLALIFFVFGTHLLYYSSEAKQYNLDLTIYIASFYFFFFNSFLESSNKKLIGLGILGGIFVWFSHLTIIFLFSISAFYVLQAIFSKNYESLKKVFIPISIWTISIGINYFLFIHNHASSNTQLSAFTSIGFFPPTPFRIQDLWWLYSTALNLIQYPLWITHEQKILIVITCGIIYLIKSKQLKLLVIASPILIHLALSFLNLYPFSGRFILYSTVSVIIFCILGFKIIINWKPQIGFVVAFIAIIYIMWKPISRSFEPFYIEEMRPVIEYIQENLEEDDAIYVYFGSKHAFDFYQDILNIDSRIIRGKVYQLDIEGYNEEIERISKLNIKRLWVLYTHNSMSEREYFLNKNKEIGELKLEFEFGGASAHLFEFNN